MNTAREAAYRVNPALWMQEVLGITPHDWQRKFLLARRGLPPKADIGRHLFDVRFVPQADMPSFALP